MCFENEHFLNCAINVVLINSVDLLARILIILEISVWNLFFIHLLVFRLSAERQLASRSMAKALSGLVAKGPSLVKGNGI